MKALFPLLVSFLILPLCVGCRSSRTGSSHTTTESDELSQSHHDSINFTEKFARYLQKQESNLTLRVVKYYPPIPGDTSSHGTIESITDLDFTAKLNSDSSLTEKSLTATSDTTSNQSKKKEEVQTTLSVKPIPWYEPFIPYIAFALLIAIFYYFRRKE